MGAEVINVPLRRDLNLDFDRVCRAAGTNTVIMIDEAYYEYARAVADYPDSLAVLSSIDAKWLVLRTFSKAYGLAGLRTAISLFVDTRRGSQEIAEQSLSHGVVVKLWGGKFSSFIRVSIGTSEQNDRFFMAFDKIVQPEP